LSQPGVTEAPFRHTCTIAHGQTILLRVRHGPDNLEAALADLKGRVEIIDAAGAVHHAVEMFQPGQYYLPPPDGEAGLAYFFAPPLPAGDYTIRLKVDQPVAALAGLDQTAY